MLALSGLVLTALLAIWRGGSRMAHAAEGSSLLTAAMVLEEALTADVRQLGVDPERRDTLLVAQDAVSLYRVHFEGAEVHLRPVRWASAPRAGGGVVLVRTEREASGKMVSKPFGQAALSSVKFALIGDRDFGNRYLRVDLLVRDPAAGDHPEESAHALVLRLPAPSGLGNPALALAGHVMPEADLLPLK